MEAGAGIDPIKGLPQDAIFAINEMPVLVNVNGVKQKISENTPIKNYNGFKDSQSSTRQLSMEKGQYEITKKSKDSTIQMKPNFSRTLES